MPSGIVAAVTILSGFGSATAFDATTSVKLLPYDAADIADSKSHDSRKNPCGDNDPEEIPQPAHEGAACELIRQETPRKGCRADESGEEPDIAGEILDRSPSKLVKLRKNRSSSKNVPNTEFSPVSAPRLLYVMMCLSGRIQCKVLEAPQGAAQQP